MIRKLFFSFFTLLLVLSCNNEPESDTTTSASIVNIKDDLDHTLSSNGEWIALVNADIESDKDIIVEGKFWNRLKIQRKLTLYSQNKNNKTINNHKLTAPKMIVRSPNFRITGGTFIGDIYVEANGFKLEKSVTVIGNIYFKNSIYKRTLTVDKTATITGQFL